MTDEKYLGDHIEDALKKVGVDKVVEKIEQITKRPCGCQKRKERLNQLHRHLVGKPAPAKQDETQNEQDKE